MINKENFVRRVCNFLQDLQNNYETADLFGFFAEPDVLFDKLNQEIEENVLWNCVSKYDIIVMIAGLLKEEYSSDFLPSYPGIELGDKRNEVAEKIYDLYCHIAYIVDGDIDDEANSYGEEQ